MGTQVTREYLEKMMELLPAHYPEPTYCCASCFKYVGQGKFWSNGLPHCSQECADKTKERWDVIKEEIEKKRDRRC